MREKLKEEDVISVENAEYLYVELGRDIVLSYRSKYVDGRFDREQLEQLVCLANSYDLSLEIATDLEYRILARLK